MTRASNWRQALGSIREGFLLTRPRSFTWTTGGLFYIDDVRVSEHVWHLAYSGHRVDARTAWLAEWDAALGQTA